MDVAIIGVPMDLGGRRRGTDMGPSAIRYAGLHKELAEIGHRVVDRGDIPVAIRETREVGDERIKYLAEVMAVCEELANWVEGALLESMMPVVLGGDHSIAVGTMAGVARAGMARGVSSGVIWFDAHGDFNTPETSPSGSIFGMPLAAIVGRGDDRLVACGGVAPKVNEENVVLIGARDLDRFEKQALRNSGIRVFSMKDIDEHGIAAVIRNAIDIASAGGSRPVHVTIDMDVIDPMYAPGVGTPETGGLTYREAHLAMEVLAESQVLGSLEVVEVNPILDQGNRTAGLAVGLISSVLGKVII